MSNAIARILFASASLVLTCTLAVASASATVRDDTAVPRATVHYADLNLSQAAGRDTLARRLRMAANSVCIDAGSPIQTLTCRTNAIRDARAALRRVVATAS